MDLEQGGSNPRRPEEVDVYGGVEGRIEVNSGGRMDHGRTTRKKFSASIVQAEAVNTDIAGYREDPPGCLFGEARAELLAEAVEAVIAEHVPVHALLGPSPAGAYEEHDLGLRQAAQHPLGQGGAQEARCAGDRDAATGERLSEHPSCLPRLLGHPSG